MKKIPYSLKIAGFIFLGTIILKNFIAEVYVVPSVSMAPTVEENDYVAVSKFSYRLATPANFPFTDIAIPQLSMPGLTSVKRGDIVLFKLPLFVKGKKKVRRINFLKRCVGLPGDTIENSNEKFVVKNRECYYKSGVISSVFFTVKDFLIRVPAKGDTILLNSDMTLILKDVILNEGHTIERKEDGRIFIDDKESSTYIVNNNYYFMCGDNKNASVDSRNWGFLPESNLIGEAFVVVWSNEGNATMWYQEIRWKRIGTFL